MLGRYCTKHGVTTICDIMDVLAVSKTKVRHVYECKTSPAQVRGSQLLRCCWTQHCLQAEFVRSAGSAHRGLLSSEELNTCHNPLLIQNLQPGRTVRPNIAIFTPNHPSILTRHQHTQVRYKEQSRSAQPEIGRFITLIQMLMGF